MSTTTHLDELSDAAALLVAETAGDEDAARMMLDALIESHDFAGAVLLLRHTITAASLALRTECQRAVEADEGMTPSVSYLVALSRHAGRADKGEGA